MKYLFLIILISVISCKAQKSIISENVTIEVNTYQDGNKTRASAMPELKTNSKLRKYQRRFDYLLMNVSEIHLPEKSKKRNQIFSFYPDTSKIKRLYLQKYIQDKKLSAYFKEAVAPVNTPNMKITKTYSVDELMEVASKFFYCDKVNSDTNVQSHVCIGINGLKEPKWEKDYTLLAAFCYEAIFSDFDKDTSQILESYSVAKKMSCQQYRKSITSLEKYLEDVKLDLFNRMKSNAVLKEELLKYYELNRTNLALILIN